MQTTEQKDKPTRKKEEKIICTQAQCGDILHHQGSKRNLYESKNRSMIKGRKIRLASAFPLATLDTRRKLVISKGKTLCAEMPRLIYTTVTWEEKKIHFGSSISKTLYHPRTSQARIIRECIPTRESGNLWQTETVSWSQGSPPPCAHSLCNPLPASQGGTCHSLVTTGTQQKFLTSFLLAGFSCARSRKPGGML